MEILTGIMIAVLIFYSGKLVMKNEIDVGSFFSFLAAITFPHVIVIYKMKKITNDKI